MPGRSSGAATLPIVCRWENGAARAPCQGHAAYSARRTDIGSTRKARRVAIADEGGHEVVAESGADFKSHRLRRANCGSFYAQADSGSTRLHRIAAPRV